MIKYIKLKSKKDTESKNFKEEGFFKEGKIYIGKIIGCKSAIIYDENKNGIYYNISMPSCFGYLYRPIKDNFTVLEGEFLAKNKKELREIIYSLYY